MAFVAVVVTALLDDGTARAPTPQRTEAPGETIGFSGSPRIGDDHWHAVYTYVVCDVVQPPAPTWESGIHTHGDGIIHMHPFQASEEGDGARLVKWFEYGGGMLSEDEVRLPGDSETHRNGDECPDGSPGVVQVFVNDERLDDYKRYVPRDGDRIRIVFGRVVEQVQLDDRTVIAAEAATRQVEVAFSQPGTEDTARFTPPLLPVEAGETVMIVLHNTDDVSHGMRISGTDGEYGTMDDFVVIPAENDPTEPDAGELVLPESDGFVVVRFDYVQHIEFRDPAVQSATGEIMVTEARSSASQYEQEQRRVLTRPLLRLY